MGGGTVLVLGGSSSGKSMYAQRLARRLAEEAGGPLFYLATMDPMDSEDGARIAKHRREREGWGFETVELPIRVGRAAARCAGGVVLLDSLTALLTNAMFSPDGFGPDAEEGVLAELAALTGAAARTVLVSDSLFSDSLFYGEETECFRRQLGHLHQRLAAESRTVVRLCYGAATVFKGAV